MKKYLAVLESKAFLLSILLAVATPFAVYGGIENDPMYSPVFDQALSKQAEKLSKSASGSNAQCLQRYQTMWRDGSLKIDWFYGYIGSDVSDVVSDGVMRFMMTEALKKACTGNLQACGFKEVAAQPAAGMTVLKKLVPQGEVQIRFWSSSQSYLNHKNTIGFGPLYVPDEDQQKHSDEIRDQFYKSFSEADIVAYDGHSEFGHGPSFTPTGVIQDVQGFLTDSHLKSFLKAMKNETPTAQVFAVAACKSTPYYQTKYMNALPGVAFAGTEISQGYLPGEQSMLGLVDSLISGRCADEINQSMVPSMGTDAGMKIYGF